MVNMLIVYVAGRRLAVDASFVKAVIEVGNVAPVPHCPAPIVGIAAQRSRALTVIDCRLATNSYAEDVEPDDLAVVVEHDGHDYGFIVDEVSEVEGIGGEPTRPAGGFGEGFEPFTIGLVETGKGAALMVDLLALLFAERQRAA